MDGDTEENGNRVTLLKRKGVTRMYKNIKMPMRLQFFAQPGGVGGGSGTNEPGSPNPEPNNQNQNNQNNQNGTQIDYDKIQQMLNGTLKAKEDTALKAYFRQQGLSQEEVEQAINTFKQQKAANTPDVNAMQTQLTQAQDAAQKAQIENAAIMQAVQLGIDSKKIPFVLKLADLSEVVDKEGKINDETLKAQLNKVLEALPELKPQANQQTGFQIGASGSNQQQGNQNDQLASIFGNKK